MSKRKREKEAKNRLFYGTAKPSYNQRKYDADELRPEWRFTGYYSFVWRGDEKFCIYGIADPRDHLIRYVGQTCKPVRVRLREHMKSPVGATMKVWLESLQQAGVDPEIVVMEWCNNWHFCEKKWIARLRAVGSLLNVTDGGVRGRHRSTANRIRCIGGPVKVFTKEEIADLHMG
jgi:hypothetical protein